MVEPKNFPRNLALCYICHWLMISDREGTLTVTKSSETGLALITALFDRG